MSRYLLGHLHEITTTYLRPQFSQSIEVRSRWRLAEDMNTGLNQCGESLAKKVGALGGGVKLGIHIFALATLRPPLGVAQPIRRASDVRSTFDFGSRINSRKSTSMIV